MDCEKCKDGKSYEWADQVKLIGGFHARLCAKCKNAWHEYVTVLPLWAEREALLDQVQDIALAATGKEEPTEKLAPIRARVRETEKEFYDIAKAWVAGTVGAGATVAAVDPEIPLTTTS